MATIKKAEDIKFSKEEKSEPLYFISGNVKYYICYGKQYSVPQKIKHRINYQMIQQLHFWVYIPKKQKQDSKRYLYTHDHSSIIHNSQKVKATQVSMCAKSLQLCMTLCDPMDCSLPDSSVQGIIQGRILEWAAIPFSGDLSNLGIEPMSLISPA